MTEFGHQREMRAALAPVVARAPDVPPWDDVVARSEAMDGARSGARTPMAIVAAVAGVVVVSAVAGVMWLGSGVSDGPTIDLRSVGDRPVVLAELTEPFEWTVGERGSVAGYFLRDGFDDVVCAMPPDLDLGECDGAFVRLLGFSLWPSDGGVPRWPPDGEIVAVEGVWEIDGLLVESVGRAPFDDLVVDLAASLDPSDAAWLLHSNGPPVTMAAQLTGTLRIDLEHRCVTVMRDGDGLEQVVVFADGARLDLSDPAAPVLILADGERFVDGSSIELGGGGRRVPILGGNQQYPVVIPEACTGEADVVFLSAD